MVILSVTSSIKTTARAVTLLTPAVLLAVFTLWSGGCSSGSAKSDPLQLGAGLVKTDTSGPVTSDAVERLIALKVGDKGADGEPVIRSLTVKTESGGTDVHLELNRPVSCHPGALVGTAVTVARLVMSSVYQHPDAGNVSIVFYGAGEGSDSQDTPAVRIAMTRASATAIDWVKLDEDNIGALATEYWVEPSVLQNYHDYGSAPIDDPALLEQAAGGSGDTLATLRR